MALNVATFRTRTLSAVIFVVIMLVGLLWNRWSFFALFTIVHFGCWKEFLGLMKAIDPDFKRVHRLWNWGFPLVGWGGMWWAFHGIPDAIEGYAWAGYVGDGFIGLGLLFVLTGTLLQPAKTGKNLWYALAGLVYISLPWFTMIFLHEIGEGLSSMAEIFGTQTFWERVILPASIPCVLILSIWINDTMAYIVGSFIGRTPFSKISPKKTWEGTIGGAVLCVGVMTLLGYYTNALNLHVFVGISIIAAVAGTAGDLLESRLKRMAGVKDSGNILPGHGGFLDRFDSLLLATPLTLVFLLLW
jgi:phosphatidate cytidylyltransferase